MQGEESVAVRGCGCYLDVLDERTGIVQELLAWVRSPMPRLHESLHYTKRSTVHVYTATHPPQPSAASSAHLQRPRRRPAAMRVEGRHRRVSCTNDHRNASEFCIHVHCTNPGIPRPDGPTMFPQDCLLDVTYERMQRVFLDDVFRAGGSPEVACWASTTPRDDADTDGGERRSLVCKYVYFFPTHVAFASVRLQNNFPLSKIGVRACICASKVPYPVPISSQHQTTDQMLQSQSKRCLMEFYSGLVPFPERTIALRGRERLLAAWDDRVLAFAMCMHPRLGSSSAARAMDDHMLEYILSFYDETSPEAMQSYLAHACCKRLQ